jgi:hypothetical protein
MTCMSKFTIETYLMKSEIFVLYLELTSKPLDLYSFFVTKQLMGVQILRKPRYSHTFAR